ncbi:MAG: RnfABCDGE type electron transport complex subunit G [Chrysiogenales bacterium]|nr:MAG: RnfABCDGE type electron transport complex subunit G [Chrysiogenales bacterium]
MKEYLKMIVVLSAISAVCGFGLARISAATKTRIEEQKLINVKGPAVTSILAGSTNDLIKDRKEVRVDGAAYVVFIGKKNGTPWALAYETEGAGYGGEMTVMIGFDLDGGTVTGIGVTSHKETPGVGSRVTDDTFTRLFKEKGPGDPIKIKTDGGVIDAITGATISSRAVCAAVEKSISLYGGIRSEALKE